MTQQSESTTHPLGTPAPAAPFPPLAEPRRLGERRVWPRTFHDRLTAPLPGLKAMARFARAVKQARRSFSSQNRPILPRAPALSTR